MHFKVIVTNRFSVSDVHFNVTAIVDAGRDIALIFPHTNPILISKDSVMVITVTPE